MKEKKNFEVRKESPPKNLLKIAYKSSLNGFRKLSKKLPQFGKNKKYPS